MGEALTRLFDEAESVFRLLGELSGAASATLRIAAGDYLARPLLVPVLSELAAEGVPVHFEIATTHSEEALSRLERGEVEMAIVSSGGERAGFEAHRLFEQPFYWIAPRAPSRHRRRAHEVPASLTERIASEPVLRLAPGSSDGACSTGGSSGTPCERSSIDVESVSLLFA